MTITKNQQGAYIVSSMIGGYRVQKVYMGYTKKEAIANFKESNNSYVA